MLYSYFHVYAMLAITVFTLASPTPKDSPLIVVNPLDRLSTVETIHGIASGRPFATTVTRSPKAISISSINTSPQGPVSTASPSHVSFSLPQQSRWGPSISNILFSCIASLIGAMSIGLTYYIYRRKSRSLQSGLWITMYSSILQLSC